MRKLMLKLATAALLVLVPVIGSVSLQYAESVSGAESLVTDALVSVLPHYIDLSEVAESGGVAFADQTLEGSAPIAASSVDLIAAGACAALIGCCILGFALLRLRFRGAPRSSWTTALRRTSPLAFPPAPLASPIRPSLTLLSISRI